MSRTSGSGQPSLPPVSDRRLLTQQTALSAERPSVHGVHRGATERLRELGWFESLPLQGIVLAILVLGFAAYPLGALVGRFRRWPVDRKVAARSRVL